MALPILPRLQEWQPNNVTHDGLDDLSINRTYMTYVTDENFDVMEVRDWPGSSSLRVVCDVTGNIESSANQVIDVDVTTESPQQAHCDVTVGSNQQGDVTQEINQHGNCDVTEANNQLGECDFTEDSNQQWQPNNVTHDGLDDLSINRTYMTYVTDENFDVMEVRDWPGSSSLRVVCDVTGNIESSANQVLDVDVTTDSPQQAHCDVTVGSNQQGDVTQEINQHGDCDVTENNNQLGECDFTQDSNQQGDCDVTADSIQQGYYDVTANQYGVCDVTIIPQATVINESSNIAHVQHIDRTHRQVCSNGNVTLTVPDPPEDDNTDDNVTPTEPSLTDNTASSPCDILAPRGITEADLPSLVRPSPPPSSRRPDGLRGEGGGEGLQAELTPRRSFARTSVSSQGSRSGSTPSEHMHSDNIYGVLGCYSTDSRPAHRSPSHITSRGQLKVHQQASPWSEGLRHRHRSTSPTSATGARSPCRLISPSSRDGGSGSVAFRLPGATSSSEPNIPIKSHLPITTRLSSICNQSNVPSSPRAGGSPPVRNAENINFEEAQMYFGEPSELSEACISQQRSHRPSRRHHMSPSSVIPKPPHSQCDTDSDDDMTSVPSSTEHCISLSTAAAQPPSGNNIDDFEDVFSTFLTSSSTERRRTPMVAEQPPIGNNSRDVDDFEDFFSTFLTPSNGHEMHCSAPYRATPSASSGNNSRSEEEDSSEDAFNTIYIPSRGPGLHCRAPLNTVYIPSSGSRVRRRSPATVTRQSPCRNNSQPIVLTDFDDDPDRAPYTLTPHSPTRIIRPREHYISDNDTYVMPSNELRHRHRAPSTRIFQVVDTNPDRSSTSLASGRYPRYDRSSGHQLSPGNNDTCMSQGCRPRTRSVETLVRDIPVASAPPMSDEQESGSSPSDEHDVQPPASSIHNDAEHPTSPSRRGQSPTSPIHHVEPPTSQSGHHLQLPAVSPDTQYHQGLFQMWRPPRTENTPPSDVMAAPPSYEDEEDGLPSYDMAAKILEANYKKDNTEVIHYIDIIDIDSMSCNVSPASQTVVHH